MSQLLNVDPLDVEQLGLDNIEIDLNIIDTENPLRGPSNTAV